LDLSPIARPMLIHRKHDAPKVHGRESETTWSSVRTACGYHGISMLGVLSSSRHNGVVYRFDDDSVWTIRVSVV